jgi:geranylgeranyl pyrophosphate synthase
VNVPLATPATERSAGVESLPAHRIHPYEKSFGYYVRLGYAIAAGATVPAAGDGALERTSSLDTAILIIDDIIDESEGRAGRPCLYREVGIKDALARAMVIQCDAFTALLQAMDLLGTPMSGRVGALERFNELHRCIYLGQQLDLAARRQSAFHPELIDRYFELIVYATSSHVRTGLETGQLIAGRQPDPIISAVADEIGMIRQICDDFNDYFPDHHEPFGDLIAGLNRLPELLFLKAGGRRDVVLQLLDQGLTDEARSMVLNPGVRAELHRYCECKMHTMRQLSAPFDYAELVEDIELILKR